MVGDAMNGRNLMTVWRGRLSLLRLRLPALVLFWAAISGLVVFLMMDRQQEAAFESKFLEEKAVASSQLQQVVEGWAQRNDQEMVQSIIAGQAVGYDVRSVALLNASNEVVAATQRAWLGAPFDFSVLGLTGPELKEFQELVSKARRTRLGQPMFTKDRSRLFVCLPAVLPSRTGDLTMKAAGVLVVEYDLQTARAALLKHQPWQFVGYLAGLLAVAGVMGVGLHFLVARRLKRLETSMAEFAQGAPFVPAKVTGHDEISHLVAQFNDLAMSVRREMAERAHAEEALRESEQKYRMLFNVANDAIFLMKNEFFTDCNPKVLEIFGCTREQIVGQPPYRFSPVKQPDGRYSQEKAMDYINKALGGEPQLFEWLHCRYDGTQFDAEVSLNRMEIVPGQVYLLAVVRDITERKRALTALRESEQRMRLHREQTPLGVIEWDLHFRVAAWNPSAERIFGYSRQEAMGRHAAELILPDSVREHVDAVWQSLLAKRGGYRSSNENVTKDGRVIVCEWYNTPLVDASGAVIGVASLVHDVTRERNAEREVAKLNAELEQRVIERTAQLNAANQELEAFSYSISHDLRAPLRAIDGFSRILSEDYRDRLDEEGLRLLNIVSSQAKRMGILIDDLLQFSRAGRQEMMQTPIDMTAMARIVFDEFAVHAKGRKLQFHLGDLPMAHGDPAMIRQVWANLLSNAIKYTSSRRVAEITVTGYREGKQNVYCVKDNGVGFEMQHADKLFGVFQRLHTDEQFEGTGVGLALAQRIIERHHGRIWAESKQNEGATFRFSLPV
jgi:PAS domain S-box-containing protein